MATDISYVFGSSLMQSMTLSFLSQSERKLVHPFEEMAASITNICSSTALIWMLSTTKSSVLHVPHPPSAL